MASDRAQILITAVDQTRTALASVKGNLEGLSVAANKVSGAMASLGLAASVAGLVAAGKAALDTADDLYKLSQKTGLSVESLSLLKPIAEQAGVSLEGLATGFRKLSTAMVESAGGGKEQVESFNRLGVSVTDTAGKLRPTEAVLLDLADAFSAMPDGAEKSAYAVKLFGKSGADMIPFLNQGRSGIEALKQKFRDLGMEISGDTAKSAEQFNDTLNTVKQALSGIAMKIAEAALPMLQGLADALVTVSAHSKEITGVLRILGEMLVVTLAVKGVAAVAALGGAFAVLRAAVMRFWPIMLAVGAFELAQWFMGSAHAADGLKTALPGPTEALQKLRSAAVQLGESIRTELDAEIKKASETVKHLATSYKQVTTDIKAIADARVASIEAGYRKQEAVAQNAARTESEVIRSSSGTMVAAEREKLTAVETGTRQMESVWRSTYAQAVALARAAGQDVQVIERQATDARVAILGQLEAAHRATVDRLIAEEQRHLQAAKSADEARLSLRLSVEDRIRELSRKGMDEQAAYQDRLRQIDEKQAQARAQLAAGNFEQARKLAEEAMAIAERNASAVTQQIEQNGRTVTQTVVSESQAAASAIGEIREAAGIADAAIKGLGSAHRQAANAAGQGAEDSRRALATLSDEIGRLKNQLLGQDKIKLDIDLEAAQSGIGKIRALTEMQPLVAKLVADTRSIEAAFDKLKTDTGKMTLLAKVEADLSRYQAAVAELVRPTSSTHTVYVRQVQAHAMGGAIHAAAESGQAMAAGFHRMAGRISGPGTETSDSIPALLSHGEFVIRASSVRRFGESFFASLNAGFIPPVPRFATGGLVGNAVTVAQDRPVSRSNASPHEVIDLRFNIAGKSHTVQSSRDTAMQLAQALRELSRGA